MVRVKQPCFSGYASGSMAKTITFRDRGNNQFCVHKFRHTQGKRSPAQIVQQEIFKKKIALIMLFRKISENRSALINRNYLGISLLGARTPVEGTLAKIPPFVLPQG